MANRIEMSDATKKGIALAIGALCVCVAVVGAALAWRVLALEDPEAASERPPERLAA